MHVGRQSHQQFSLSSGLWTRALMVLPAVTLLAQEPVGNPEPGWSTVLAVGEPTARHEAAMVAVGGKGYLMGGRGIKPVEEFNPATSSWRQLGPTPFEMHHFQPVEIGGLVYVVTAMTGKYPKETPLDAWHTYDPAQDLWKEGGPIPAARRRGGAGTVAYRGKIYVAGGIVDGHTSGTVPWFDEFDPGDWRVANTPGCAQAPRPLPCGCERGPRVSHRGKEHQLPRAGQLHRILRRRHTRSGRLRLRHRRVVHPGRATAGPIRHGWPSRTERIDLLLRGRIGQEDCPFRDPSY